MKRVIAIAGFGCLMGCSSQQQIQPASQVSQQQTPVKQKTVVRTVVKNKYIKAKHCHTFQGISKNGYAYSSRKCHAHPVKHKHPNTGKLNVCKLCNAKHARGAHVRRYTR